MENLERAKGFEPLDPNLGKARPKLWPDLRDVFLICPKRNNAVIFFDLGCPGLFWLVASCYLCAC
jgi:hypothetical protein